MLCTQPFGIRAHTHARAHTSIKCEVRKRKYLALDGFPFVTTVDKGTCLLKTLCLGLWGAIHCRASGRTSHSGCLGGVGEGHAGDNWPTEGVRRTEKEGGAEGQGDKKQDSRGSRHGTKEREEQRQRYLQ